MIPLASFVIKLGIVLSVMLKPTIPVILLSLIRASIWEAAASAEAEVLLHDSTIPSV